jgi:hypothetical protein
MGNVRAVSRLAYCRNQQLDAAAHSFIQKVRESGGEGQNLSTRASELLVKSTFPGDWAIGTPRISRSSNVRK